MLPSKFVICTCLEAQITRKHHLCVSSTPFSTTPMMNELYSSVALGALAIWLVNRWMKYRREEANIGGMPGPRMLFGIFS